MSDQSYYVKYCDTNQNLSAYFDVNPYFQNICYNPYEIITEESYTAITKCIQDANNYKDSHGTTGWIGKANINNLLRDLPDYSIIKYFEHFKDLKEILNNNDNRIAQYEIIYGDSIEAFKTALQNLKIPSDLKYKVAKTCCDHSSGGSGDSGGGCNCHWYRSSPSAGCTGVGFWA